MPLDQAERNALSRRISEVITNEFGFTGPAYRDTDKYPTGAVMGGGGGGGLGAPQHVESGFLIAAETLLLRLDGAVALLATLLEKAIGDIGGVAPEQPDPAKPKNKGGRPRKEQGAPSTANGAGPEAGFAPKPPAQDDSDIFGDPNKPKDDPLGVPEEPKQPAPPPQQPPLTDVQVKDALRTYMQAFGTEGTARLTDLLTRVAGVKRFSDLPANKWAAVIQAANNELAGR